MLKMATFTPAFPGRAKTCPFPGLMLGSKQSSTYPGGKSRSRPAQGWAGEKRGCASNSFFASGLAGDHFEHPEWFCHGLPKKFNAGIWRLFGLSLAILLVSCAGGREAPSDTELVFKHGKLAGDPRVMEDLLHEFERQHPGVTVREEVLPSSTDQQHQYYAINFDSGSVPFDLFAADVIWVSEFARAGWIRPLDAIVSSNEQEAYFASTVEAATFDGHLYAIPWYIDVGVLYYRKDLLERYGFGPPRTWPELVRIAQIVLEGQRDANLKGFVWPGKQYEGLVCVAFEFIWGHGGSILDPNGRLDAEEALRFMRDLIVREGVSPPLVSTADEEATRLLFGDGRAVFMRNWPYVWSLLQQPGSLVRDKVGVASLPSFSGYAPASTLGGWMLAMPSVTAHPRLAADLAKFLTASHVQQRLARELGYHPALRSLYADPSMVETDPSLTDLYPVFLTARPRPVTPYYLMLSQVLQPEFSAVVVGRKSSHDAIVSATRQIAEILNSDSTRDEAERSRGHDVAFR
jgi:multiple sugar transport system substrate-binding protein